MFSDSPLISVIIISFNTRETTIRCLEAFQKETSAIPSDVIVVDNASTDGSIEAIRAAFPNVQMIANSKNVGFGAANNQAMRVARGQWFLLLNSDAFVRPGALTALLKYMEEHKEVALVGPRLLNADGTLQQSCYRFPSPMRAWAENLWLSAVFTPGQWLGDYRRWAHDRECCVDWVVGACCMVRRQVFEQIGGFDEHFFMYAEETDWQHRMRAGGWQIGFTPSVEVVHLGGASGDKPKANSHAFDSLDRYERKHHGISGLVSLRAAMIVGCSLRLLLWAITFVFRPTRRAVAKAKVQLMGWLLWRQATCWRLSVINS